ncbi:MAG: hypothetical protein KAS90_06675 [Candidatus Aenigmarchaeota archaeon]|nr:hypothetical protein [Candidatus Aenigmarchaeota archaeon]
MPDDLQKEKNIAFEAIYRLLTNFPEDSEILYKGKTEEGVYTRTYQESESGPYKFINSARMFKFDGNGTDKDKADVINSIAYRSSATREERVNRFSETIPKITTKIQNSILKDSERLADELEFVVGELNNLLSYTGFDSEKTIQDVFKSYLVEENNADDCGNRWQCDFETISDDESRNPLKGFIVFQKGSYAESKKNDGLTDYYKISIRPPETPHGWNKTICELRINEDSDVDEVYSLIEQHTMSLEKAWNKIYNE